MAKKQDDHPWLNLPSKPLSALETRRWFDDNATNRPIPDEAARAVGNATCRDCIKVVGFDRVGIGDCRKIGADVAEQRSG